MYEQWGDEKQEENRRDNNEEKPDRKTGAG
jgi:hypothetical protein